MMYFLFVLTEAMIWYRFCFFAIDKKLVLESSFSHDFPARTISLFHSIITSLIGFGYYFLGILNVTWIREANAFIIAYLFYDFTTSLKKWKTSNGDEQVKKSFIHVLGVVFHHVVTVFFLNGFLLFDSYCAISIFCIAEVPIICINIKWFLTKFQASHMRMFKIISGIEIWTYLLLRIVMFGTGFIFHAMKNISLFSLTTWMALPLLLLVFLLNVKWFFDLLSRDKPVIYNIVVEYLKEAMNHPPIQAILSRFI